MRMSSKKRHSDLKSLFRALSLLGFLCFFILGVLNKTTTSSSSSPKQDTKHANMLVKGDDRVRPNLDVNKRRVPNGPDPIHNRRAGNSRRPPGQA
ncbi:hypothetical protein L1887_15269 [Cichorium endivia]|nr:hypothetical protein L1887_15269 [Cichorium endivia]